MELQNELTEKHATEKQVLLKREADLQNIVSGFVLNGIDVLSGYESSIESVIVM